MQNIPNPLDILKKFELSHYSLLGVGTIIGMKQALLSQQNSTSTYISTARIAIGKEISEKLVKKIPAEKVPSWGNQLATACSHAITFTDEGIVLRNWATLIISEQELLEKGFPSSTNFVSQMNSFWSNLAEISVIDFANNEGVKFSFKLNH